MAQSRVHVAKNIADADALQSWLNALGADVSAGKVEGFNLSIDQIAGGTVAGELMLSATTAISGLTVDIEDA